MALNVSGRKRPKWIYVVLAAVILVGALIIWGRSQLTAPPPDMQISAPVRINQGVLTGGVDLANPDILQFNGIPFASAERWSAPSDPIQWGAEVRDARAFGPECMQSRQGMGEFVNDIVTGLNLPWWKRMLASSYVSAQTPADLSEDCLFLNVRTANLDGETPAPVMVWIHGGSHVSGAGSQAIYQGNNLVEKGAVLVTINYRLGAFGYLAHPALTAADGTSGNYGVLDQIAALEWVRDNIAFFGGDPENITLFGESAGAQSVTEVMASPLSEGLFHKAILQSGASSYNAIHLSDSPIPHVRSAEDVGADLLEGLAPANDAAKLRAIPAETIVAQMDARPDIGGYWLPNVDGKIIPRVIGDQIGWGGAARIPVLAGYNADEATLFYDSINSPTVLKAPITGPLEDREAALADVFGTNSAKALQALYGMLDETSWDAGAEDMLGDDMFGVHMRFLGKANAASGQPTWLYFFSKQPPTKGQTLGAYHASELAFVFDTHSPLLPKTATTDQLTDQIGAYWVNFARTGNPNGDALPEWPAYSGETDTWLELGEPVQVRDGVRARKLDILEAALIDRAETVRTAKGQSGALVWNAPARAEPAPPAGEIAEAAQDDAISANTPALVTISQQPAAQAARNTVIRPQARRTPDAPVTQSPPQAPVAPAPVTVTVEDARPPAPPTSDGMGVATSFIRPNPAPPEPEIEPETGPEIKPETGPEIEPETEPAQDSDTETDAPQVTDPAPDAGLPAAVEPDAIVTESSDEQPLTDTP